LTLRPAVEADAALLGRLLGELQREIGEPLRPDAATAFARDGFGAAPAFTAVVAERAGQAAGYALFWPTYDTESASRGGWLSDLYVRPDHRHRGVAYQLMAEIARRTAAAGGRYLVWLVHTHNEPARAFYRRIGKEWPEGTAWFCEGAMFDALADGTHPPA
jgi:ribosomal protein S18 acetylase RimI-like enzyme